MAKKHTKNTVRSLQTSDFLAFPRKMILNLLSRTGLVLASYSEPDRLRVIRMIRKIREESNMLMGYNEAYQIFMATQRTEKIEGDIAEVGVYKGSSAKLICEAKRNKTLHLFDTFEGLPELSDLDDTKQFYSGQYPASFEAVKNYLKKYPNVHFYKGIFPETAEPIKNKRFSFVNLDVDIHEPTLKSLEFFYSRMNKGGVIVSHDYTTSIGVRKAFDDFFKNKLEPIIELSGSQCLVVKL